MTKKYVAKNINVYINGNLDIYMMYSPKNRDDDYRGISRIKLR